MKKILSLINHVFTQWLRYRYVDPLMKIAAVLVVGGVAILVGGGLWSILISFDFLPVSIEIGPGTPVGIGLVLILMGVLLGIYRQSAIDKTTTGILIIHKAMAGMDTSSPRAALPRKMSSGRLDIISLVEGKFHQNGRLIDPSAALRTISNIDQQLASRLGGDNKAMVAYAGLAPIPLLVTAGYRVSSRQISIALDFDRTRGWHALDEIDNKEELIITRPEEPIHTECALVMPFSVNIGVEQVPTNLRQLSYWLQLGNGPRADSLNSEEKQRRIGMTIYNLLAGLRSDWADLEVVHIFLASQASWAYRLGTLITMSVHPSLRIYQFEDGRYSWSVKIRAGEDPTLIQ